MSDFHNTMCIFMFQLKNDESVELLNLPPRTRA